jgi:hypothetical protein
MKAKLQPVLDALEQWTDETPSCDLGALDAKIYEAIATVKELMQPAQTVREQEPVAWAVVGEGGYDRLDGHKQFIGLSIQKPVTFFGSTAMPLYAALQGAPKPLTNEQIKEGYLEHDLKYAFVSSAWSFTAGVEFAEAAHGIGGVE